MQDDLGRNIGSGMDPAQLKSLIESLAKGDMGKPKPFNKSNGDGMEKLVNDLKAYASKFSGSIKKFEELVTSVKDFISKSGSEKSKASDKRMGKNAEVADKAMKKLADKGLKKGSIWTHDMYVEKMQKLMYLEMKKQTAVAQGNLTEIASLENLISTGVSEIEVQDKLRENADKGGAGSRYDELAKRFENVSEELVPLLLMSEQVEKFGESIGELQKKLMGFRATEVLFKDLFAAERQFTVDTRQIAFEIAGATKESRGLQRSFEDIGKTAAQTGFDRTENQQAYLKALRRGAKEQKTALSITKNQLNTEKMIGVQAGSLEDTFTNMSLQMGMNNSQMAQFGRGLLDVARNTGVSGENLARAVQSSESIMKNMRNTGTLTAKAASNVVGLMASAEKFGVGEFAQQFTDVLSQGMSGFIHADQKMQIILGQALGHNAQLMEKMRNGTIMQTKEGMRGLAEGMEDTLARFSGGRVRTSEDFAKLSDQEKMLLNTRMKEATGRTAVEFLQVTKSLNEAAEPLSKKLEKIAEQKKKNLTLEEKATLLEQERSLKTSSGLEALAEFQDKMISSGGNMEEAFKAITSGEIGKDLQSLGVDISSGKGAMKGAMDQAIQGLNDGLKKVGKSTVDISADRLEKAFGDQDEMSKINQELTDAQQLLAAEQKAQADPMSKLNKTMQDLNDTLRGTTQGAISTMMNSAFAGAFGILSTLVDIGGVFAGFVLASVVEYGSLKRSLSLLTKNFSKLSFNIPKFSEILKKTGSIGDSLRSNILDSLDIFGKKTSNIFKKMSKGAGDFYSVFLKGFKRSKIAGDGFFKSLKRGFSGMVKSNSITRSIFDNISQGISKGKGLGTKAFGIIKAGITQGFKFLTDGSLTKGLKVGFSSIKKVFSGGAGGVLSSFKAIFSGKSILGATMGFGKLLSGGVKLGLRGAMAGIRATLVGGTLGLAQIAFSVIDGVFGAVYGFQKTGERFSGVLKAMGKSTSDLTWGMYASSTIAGALVGILDGLTFGLLKMSGAGEFLEQVITYLAYVTFSFLEGVVDGIMVAYNMIKPALKFLYDQFAGIGKALLGLFNSITSIFGGAEAKSMGEAFAMLYPYIKMIGKAIGMIVGVPLGAVLWLVVKAISAVVSVFTAVINAVTGVINILKGFVKFFYDIWSVGIWQAFKNLGGTIWNAVAGVFQPIFSYIYETFKPLIDFVWGIAQGIMSPFNWLYDVLVGHSIVPDLVSDIVMFFATLPFEILKGLARLPFMFIDWVGQMFGLMPGAIGKALYSAASTVGLGWLVDKMMGTSGGVSPTSPTDSLVAASTTATPVATTAATTTIGEKTERDTAKEALSMPELGEIASSSEQQVNRMDQMISLLAKIADGLGQSTEPGMIENLVSSFTGADTSGDTISTSPPKYYKWSIGKHNQTAALGVSNLANTG